VYGVDMVQLSYRGRVADDVEVTISHEHDGARWVRPQDMRALLSDEFIAQLADGNEGVESILRHVATDLDRYLRRIHAER